MVPAHLQGENNGLSVSESSDKQILHNGTPELEYDGSLTTIAAPFSLNFGTITLEGNVGGTK